MIETEYDSKGNVKKKKETTKTRVVKGSWQAAAWLLERRYAQSYGRIMRQDQEKDGPEEGLTIVFNRPAIVEEVPSDSLSDDD